MKIAAVAMSYIPDGGLKLGMRQLKVCHLQKLKSN